MPPVRLAATYLTVAVLVACRPESSASDAGDAAPAASAAPSASSAAGPRTVIYDSAVSGPQAGIRTNFDDAEGPRVFAPLFPRYLANNTLCDGKTMTPAASRKVGQFAPALAAEASGGFTRAKAPQILEIVARNECGITVSDPTASRVAAVFEGKKVVAQMELPSGATLVGTFDENDDGRLELLLAYAWERDGARGADLSSAKVETSGMVVLREFGEIFRDGCRAGALTKERSTGRLVAVGAKGRATLVVERETKACR